MSSSLKRLALIGYVFGLSLILCLLLSPSSSQAQFGVSTGWRATPGLPTLAILTVGASTSGIGGNAGGSVLGISGNVGGTNVSGSFSTQIIHVSLGQFFPNNGQIIGLPMPTLQPQLNNYMTDSTGALWSLLFTGGLGGGGGGGGGLGGGGIGGGGLGGIGGGIAGGGLGGIGGGGIGGFAGKGMGGFNGKKAL